MLPLFRRTSIVVALGVVGVLTVVTLRDQATTTAAPPAMDQPETVAPAAAQPPALTVDDLRRGGYVIFFRHTVADQGSDAQVINLEDCSTQRNMGPQGLPDARLIGQSFRLQGIPVGQVWSSEFCRALETASIAFRRVQPEMGLNFCISADGGATCSDQRPLNQDQRFKYFDRALTTLPLLGTNTVLVGHGVGIVADLQMGEAAIYQPDGLGSFVRVARVLPAEWMNGVYAPGGAR
jgi:hypothetical protein